MSTTPRYVAQFQHVEDDRWEDTAYFKSGDLERAEQFVMNMVGANKHVKAGRLYDQIRDEARAEITKDNLTHTVHCLDDKTRRAHFTSVEAASAYANDLLGQGHKVQLLPYQNSPDNPHYTN